MNEDKRISLTAAASLVQSGQTLALGGTTLYRRPVAFVYEMLRRTPRPTNLTLMCFTAGYESDLLIGASALELGYGVGTSNVRHFQLIPGLNVIQL